MNENREIREVIDFDSIMEGAKSAAIAGHARPDGDCVGAALGLGRFLKEHFPQAKIDVCLEMVPPEFFFLEGADTVLTDSEGKTYDVFFCLDCSTASRLGQHAHLMKDCAKTVCIDHHLTAAAQAQICYIDPQASSASELTALAVGLENIDEKAAECFYTGIVHDTGVFQYPCTSSRTMRLAGALMDKGIPYSRICEESFFAKTYLQQHLLARAIQDSQLFFEGRVIASVIRKSTLDAYGASTSDLSGIVAQLRNTTGVEASVFLYEMQEGEFRVSLRSNEKVDVCKVAVCFGGGGHIRAAGCTVCGDPDRIVEKLCGHIGKQLED